MSDGLTILERAVLDCILEGEHPVLENLRAQAAKAVLTRRDNTGVGFYCRVAVPETAALLAEPTDFQIADVAAEISGLRNGAGFVLFIRKGRIDMLEGFTFGEPWPEQVGDFSLRYAPLPRRFPF